jgi:hypothetical protein
MLMAQHQAIGVPSSPRVMSCRCTPPRRVSNRAAFAQILVALTTLHGGFRSRQACHRSRARRISHAPSLSGFWPISGHSSEIRPEPGQDHLGPGNPQRTTSGVSPRGLMGTTSTAITGDQGTRARGPGLSSRIGGPYWIESGHTVLRFRHGALPPSMRPRGQPQDVVALATALPTLDERSRNLEDIARSTIPVVLRGETGTGKEVLARAVHQLSGRPGELIAINCGALPAASLKPSCSATARERSPAPPRIDPAWFAPPTAARCSSTRSAIFLRHRRSRYSGCYRRARYARSGPLARSRSTFA